MINLVIDNENRQYALETEDAISAEPVDFGDLACLPGNAGKCVCVYIAQFGDANLPASVVEVSAISPHAVVAAVPFEIVNLGDGQDLEGYIDDALEDEEDEPGEPGDDDGTVLSNN